MSHRVARALAGIGLAVGVAVGGCATGGGPAARPSGVAEPAARPGRRVALDAWVVGGDVAAAAQQLREALARDPADPWARAGSAALARRDLDEAAEAEHLLALLERAPAHPLAVLAARRLGELAQVAPPLARLIEDRLAAAQPRLAGMVAARARVARGLAASALGQRVRAEALRVESGVVTAWTLAGPFGALPALELDRPFAPERGTLPATVPVAAGLPDAPSRTIPCPDGVVALDGEPGAPDVLYLAAIATAARGGDYLLSVGGTASFRVFLDGAPVVERRAQVGFPPLTQVVPVALGAGSHHLLVKLGRGPAAAQFGAALLRRDGAVSDVTFGAPAPGSPVPEVRSAPLPAPTGLPRQLVAALEADGSAASARLLVAREAIEGDREAAKELLEEALAVAPGSPALLAARAEARRDDPTLAERMARARAEGDLDRVLASDPVDAAARVARAELALAGDRLEDARAQLDALPPAAAARPRALVTAARLARARGLADLAERLAEEARRTGGDCAAQELLLSLASRRDALSRRDELNQGLALCPGGLERTVEVRRRRGDLAGALAAADEVVRAAPARVDARFQRAALLAAAGWPDRAAADLADLGRLWPRDPRIDKRRAGHLDAAGDPAGALAARERALLLDGADLALRRALAIDRGAEPLDAVAVDGAAAIADYRTAPAPHATSSVTVLDFGAVEAHPGGAYTERVHEVVEARDEGAVDRIGEVAIPEGATLLVARTLKRDGRILEPEEPLGEKRTLSLAGLEPGDFAEWEWLRAVPARGAAVPGFTADPFYFRADVPLWRSVYVARSPAAVGLELDARRLEPAARVTRSGGVAEVRVERRAVPPLFPEPAAPSDAEHLPFLQVGAGAGQDALALAMADALLPTFRPSLEVRALAAGILAGVPPGDRAGEGLVRAAYRRVSELVLGQGGSFTEPAGAILSRGRGSRTVLLKSVLDALGVRARVALARDFTRDPAPYRFPRTDLYGHALLRVEHGGQTFWLDPSTRGAPFGSLPGSSRAVEALVLPEPGEPLVVARTPVGGADEERRVTRVAVTVDPDGGAAVLGEETYRGVAAAGLRGTLERMDATARRQGVEQILARSFRGVALEAVEVDGEGALEGPLVLRWRATVARWARLEDGRAVVDAPLFPARVGARFASRKARETPLLVGDDERASLELSVTLPAGWSAVPAEPLRVGSAHGTYTRQERAEAGRLVRSDAYELRRARVAPDAYPGFAAFARAVDAAQERPMVFVRGDQPR